MQIKLRFVIKIWNNMTDCPELLQNINFIIYIINCRILNVFYTKHTITVYVTFTN